MGISLDDTIRKILQATFAEFPVEMGKVDNGMLVHD